MAYPRRTGHFYFQFLLTKQKFSIFVQRKTLQTQTEMENLLVGAINDKLFNQIVKATGNDGGLYLLVDSYGGDLRAGYKIYDYLKGRDNVYCNVIGNCMSAAVLVLLGVKKENRTANEHAQFLIHRPLLEYNGQLTQKVAKQVDSAIENETASLLKVYKKELTASDAALLSMLDAEQVFGARQAVAMGFISSVNAGNAEKQGELEEAAMLDIAYNQKLINKSNMNTNDKLKACLEEIKNLFAGDAFKNAKVVSTVDGKDIKVATDGEIEKGNKCDAADGTYTLGDNRNIIVKDGVIESIEEPKTPEPDKKADDPAKKTDGDDDEKKALKEQVKNLTESETNLKNELETAKAEIESLKDVKTKMAEFEKVNKLIDDAGGIDAVLGAFSKEPNKKSEGDGLKDDASYEFIKGLGAMN